MTLVASFVCHIAVFVFAGKLGFGSQTFFMPLFDNNNYLVWLAIALLVLAGLLVGWLLEGDTSATSKPQVPLEKNVALVQNVPFMENRLYEFKPSIIVQLAKSDKLDKKTLLTWLVCLKRALPTNGSSQRPVFSIKGLNETVSKQEQDQVVLVLVADTQGLGLNLEIQDVGSAQKLVPLAGDFPLAKLEGLLMPLSKAHRDFMALGVYGAGLRGVGEADLVYHPSLVRWADRLLKHAHYIRRSQSRLSQEMKVAATWAHLWIGIHKKDQDRLRRVIESYQEIIEHEDEAQRHSFERLMLHSNLALAAHALSEISQDYRARSIAHQHAVRALSFVDKPKQGALWAQLVEFCWRYMPDGSAHLHSRDKKTSTSPPFSEELFAEVCAFWRLHNDQAQINSLTKLHGDLVIGKAKGMMGAYAFQKAEGLYLQALNGTKRWQADPKHKQGYSYLAGGFPVSQCEIHRALGAAYFEWGRRCGDLDLIQRSELHWRTVLNANGSDLSHKEQAKLKIAQTHLLLGGASNDRHLLKHAVHELTELSPARLPLIERHNVARLLGVAKARSTLLDQNSTLPVIDEALRKLAEAEASPQGDVWPAQPLLNRLSARLYALGFEVSGSEAYLAKAIERRHRALEARSAGHDLDWIHDASELAQLLAVRQNLSPNGDEDFFKSHYLIEEALERFEQIDRKLDDDQCLQNAKADLWKVKAELLGSFARQRHDEKSIEEAIVAYRTSISFQQNSATPLAKADGMKNLAQLLIDQSERFNNLGQLKEAESLFARAYDIYKAEGLMAQAARMRGYIQNLAAARVAYQIAK